MDRQAEGLVQGPRGVPAAGVGRASLRPAVDRAALRAEPTDGRGVQGRLAPVSGV